MKEPESRVFLFKDVVCEIPTDFWLLSIFKSTVVLSFLQVMFKKLR